MIFESFFHCLSLQFYPFIPSNSTHFKSYFSCKFLIFSSILQLTYCLFSSIFAVKFLLILKHKNHFSVLIQSAFSFDFYTLSAIIVNHFLTIKVPYISNFQSKINSFMPLIIPIFCLQKQFKTTQIWL